MKKILIPLLISINLLTIYFWLFRYQTKTALVTNELVNRTLKRQFDIIGTAISQDIKLISRETEAYPQYEPWESEAKKIYESKKEIVEILTRAIDELYTTLNKQEPKQKWFEGDLKKLKFWSRIQPFHYRIPKQVLFKNNGLKTIFEVINQQQDSLLATIDSDTLKQVLQKSHFINTNEMFEKFKNVPFMKAVVLLQSMKNQTATTAQFMVAHHLKSVKDEVNAGLLKVNDFAIMTSMKKSVYEVGEIVECDIFTTVYYDSDELLVEVNGVEKTMKNGIADFTFIPKSTGVKILNVKITDPNRKSLWNSYRKEFEYLVIE